MNVNDYGKYNFADMLISIEEEMENHITALRTARKQIGLLWNDCDRMSERICYLESILDMHNIDYSRDDETQRGCCVRFLRDEGADIFLDFCFDETLHH